MRLLSCCWRSCKLGRVVAKSSIRCKRCGVIVVNLVSGKTRVYCDDCNVIINRENCRKRYRLKHGLMERL